MGRDEGDCPCLGGTAKERKARVNAIRTEIEMLPYKSLRYDIGAMRRKLEAELATMAACGAGPMSRANKVKLTTELSPDKLPLLYQMVVVGDCLHPKIKDGSRLEFSTDQPFRTGDFVAIWCHLRFVLKGEHQVIVKRLILKVGGDSNVSLLSGERGYLVEMLNPPRTFTVPEEQVEVVHQMVRIVDADEPAIMATPNQIAAMSRKATTLPKAPVVMRASMSAPASITRRQALSTIGAAGAAAAVVAVPTAVSATPTESRIPALFREWYRLMVEAHPAPEEVCSALCRRAWAIEAEMLSIPPVTAQDLAMQIIAITGDGDFLLPDDFMDATARCLCGVQRIPRGNEGVAS